MKSNKVLWGALIIGIALAAGKYKLEVVTQHSHSSTLLKEPRAIKAEPELTVA